MLVSTPGRCYAKFRSRRRTNSFGAAVSVHSGGTGPSERTHSTLPFLVTPFVRGCGSLRHVQFEGLFRPLAMGMDAATLRQ